MKSKNLSVSAIAILIATFVSKSLWERYHVSEPSKASNELDQFDRKAKPSKYKQNEPIQRTITLRFRRSVDGPVETLAVQALLLGDYNYIPVGTLTRPGDRTLWDEKQGIVAIVRGYEMWVYRCQNVPQNAELIPYLYWHTNHLIADFISQPGILTEVSEALKLAMLTKKYSKIIPLRTSNSVAAMAVRAQVAMAGDNAFTKAYYSSSSRTTIEILDPAIEVNRSPKIERFSCPNQWASLI